MGLSVTISVVLRNRYIDGTINTSAFVTLTEDEARLFACELIAKKRRVTA
jgi:hypothetical protein